MTLFDEIEIEREILFEGSESGSTGKGFIHPETHHDPIRGQLTCDIAEVITKLRGTDPETDFVSRVGKRAELNALSRIGSLEQ